MHYFPAEDRYTRMKYRRCGKSGLRLPALSFGLWHNFGHDRSLTVKRDMCRTAFD
ncbi:MAG: L-glyceraldehyde 3-phosphate reductase, partial [Mangrovicoccus sp.]